MLQTTKGMMNINGTKGTKNVLRWSLTLFQCVFFCAWPVFLINSVRIGQGFSSALWVHLVFVGYQVFKSSSEGPVLAKYSGNLFPELQRIWISASGCSVRSLKRKTGIKQLYASKHYFFSFSNIQSLSSMNSCSLHEGDCEDKWLVSLRRNTKNIIIKCYCCFIF